MLDIVTNSPRIRTEELIDSRFRIGEIRYSGAREKIFRAFDLELDLPVEIHFLISDSLEHLSYGELWEVIEAELSVLTRIKHPDLCCPIYGGISRGQAFLVYPEPPGFPLRSYLASSKPSKERTLSIAEALLSSISALHSAGALHWDINPDSIYVELRDGVVSRAVLVNLGSARIRLAKTSTMTLLTRASQTIGSPECMSPELFSGSFSSQASDLYSAGIVLYQSLAGEPPFRSEILLDLLLKHLHEQPTPVELVAGGDDLSVRLRKCVDRLLEKSSESRPSSAKEALEMLAAPKILVPEPLVVSQSSRNGSPVPERQESQEKKLPLVSSTKSFLTETEGAFCLPKGDPALLATEEDVEFRLANGELLDSDSQRLQLSEPSSPEVSKLNFLSSGNSEFSSSSDFRVLPKRRERKQTTDLKFGAGYYETSSRGYPQGALAPRFPVFDQYRMWILRATFAVLVVGCVTLISALLSASNRRAGLGAMPTDSPESDSPILDSIAQRGDSVVKHDSLTGDAGEQTARAKLEYPQDRSAKILSDMKLLGENPKSILDNAKSPSAKVASEDSTSKGQLSNSIRSEIVSKLNAIPAQDIGPLQFTVKPLDGIVTSSQHRLTGLLVDKIEVNSVAYKAGLRRLDVIKSVESKGENILAWHPAAVSHPADLQAAVLQAQQNDVRLALIIKRGSFDGLVVFVLVPPLPR